MIMSSKTLVMGLTALGGAYASQSLHFNFPNATSPTPFNISVDRDLINFASDRASTFRVSQSLYPGWSNEGAPTELMSELAAYWAEDYDWNAVEDKINQLSHYATTVPGNRGYDAPIPLHFIHQESANKSAVPLLFLHGWTSTHLEWTEIIAPLSDAFHIIAPDLPGYGFGPAPTQPGLGPREMGIAYDSLMKQLGYDTYGIVITDLGWVVGGWMAIDVPDSLIGHFTDFQLIFPTPEDLERMANNETTSEENKYIMAVQEFATNHFAYSTMQAQKPLALSWSMADSPVGFAGWLWDLKYAASDGYEYSFEEIITETLTLWIQEPYTSMRAYVDFTKVSRYAPLHHFADLLTADDENSLSF